MTMAWAKKSASPQTFASMQPIPSPVITMPACTPPETLHELLDTGVSHFPDAIGLSIFRSELACGARCFLIQILLGLPASTASEPRLSFVHHLVQTVNACLRAHQLLELSPLHASTPRQVNQSGAKCLTIQEETCARRLLMTTRVISA